MSAISTHCHLGVLICHAIYALDHVVMQLVQDQTAVQFNRFLEELYPVLPSCGFVFPMDHDWSWYRADCQGNFDWSTRTLLYRDCMAYVLDLTNRFQLIVQPRLFVA